MTHEAVVAAALGLGDFAEGRDAGFDFGIQGLERSLSSRENRYQTA